MTRMILGAVAAAACMASGSCFAAAQAPAAPRVCLNYDDLEQLHAISNMSAIATTRRGAYMVMFRGTCQAMSTASFFILHRNRLGTCLDTGDRLDISEPGSPCVVESVVPTRSVPFRSGRE